MTCERPTAVAEPVGTLGFVFTDFTPIEQVPKVALVAPPRPSRATTALLAGLRTQLTARPGGFDGPVLMVGAASAERIDVFPATYSWAVAADRGLRGVGLGMLGVKLWLEREGLALWQLRGPHVAEGGTWDYAAAGAVEPGQAPEQAVVREAAEELSIDRADLVGLRPVLLAAGQGRGAAIIYTAELAPHATPRPDPAEVAELTWGGEPPGPLCRCSAASLPALRSVLLSG